MRRIAPEPTGQWVGRIIRETLGWFLRSPFAVILAALFPTMVEVIAPQRKTIDEFTQQILTKGFDKLSQIDIPKNDILAYLGMSFFASCIAYVIVFGWADRKRLNREWSVTDLMASIGRLPRMLYAMIVQTAVLIASSLLILPVALLGGVHALFVVIFILLFMTLLAFIMIRWIPKFDYFIAGMTITREPTSVLLREWWEMPNWLWVRFLLLMITRFFFIVVISILLLPLSTLGKGIPAIHFLNVYLIGVANMLPLAMVAVGFVRGRDEWAELSDRETPEANDASREWIV